jgi:hypothetical protein
MSSSASSSRQKSCNACVRSKRRCDKTLPACTRCSKKGWLCLYGASQMDERASAFGSAGLAGLAPEADASMDLAMDIDLDMVPDFPVGPVPGLDVNLNLAPPNHLDDGSSDGFGVAGAQYDSFIESLLNPKDDPSATWLSELPKPANGEKKAVSRKDYSNMPHMCVSEGCPW